jgi:hypothetical protein
MTSQFDNTLVYGRLRAEVEHDGGLLCRLLELFAARGVTPLAVDYRVNPRAEPPTAVLRVDAQMGAQDWAILCARARQAIGVLQLTESACGFAEERAAA